MDHQTENIRSSTPFHHRTSNCPPNANKSNTKSSGVLKERAHSNERNSRSHTLHISLSSAKVPAAAEKISNSRVLDRNRSIPKSTNELVALGFEILNEQRAQRLKGNKGHPQSTNNNSIGSSNTYICSHTDRSGPTSMTETQQDEIANIQDDLREMRDLRAQMRKHWETQEANLQAMNAGIEAVKSDLLIMKWEREANARAMEAGIEAAKRAAILMRELKNKAVLEQTIMHKTDIGCWEDGQKRVRHVSNVPEAPIGSGNGTKDKKDAVSVRPQRVPKIRIHFEDMDGKPLALPIQPKVTLRVTHDRDAHRKQEKRSAREKLRLCPKCIPATQELASTMTDRYAKQNLITITPSDNASEERIHDRGSLKKPLRIESETYHSCSRAVQPNSITITAGPSHQSKTATFTTSRSSHSNRKSVHGNSSHARKSKT